MELEEGAMYCYEGGAEDVPGEGEEMPPGEGTSPGARGREEEAEREAGMWEGMGPIPTTSLDALDYDNLDTGDEEIAFGTRSARSLWGRGRRRIARG